MPRFSTSSALLFATILTASQCTRERPASDSGHSVPMAQPSEPHAAQAERKAAVWTRIEVRNQNDVTNLVRTPALDWQVASPISANADVIAVGEVTRALDTLQLTTVVDPHPDATALQRYGIDPPQWTVSATSMADGAEGLMELQGGYENDYDGRSYVRSGRFGAVYSVEGSARRAFAKSTYDLRDKSILAVDPKTVIHLSLATKANNWSIQKTDASTWMFEKPFVDVASQTQIDSILATLKAVKAVSFVKSETINSAALGLETPDIDLGIRTSSNESIRIRIGRLVSNQRYARRDDARGTSVALVSSEAGLQLDRPAADLIDKTVVQFDRSQVARIELHRGAEAVVVVQKQPNQRDRSEGWRVVAPVDRSLQLLQVTGILWNLGSMKAGAIVMPRPSDLSKFGIHATSPQIAVFSADGAELARLSAGATLSAKPGYVYAASSNGRLAEVHRARIDAVVNALGEFATRVPDGGR